MLNDKGVKNLALAVIRDAFIGHFVGLDGHTAAGHRFPGAWLNRRPGSRAAAAAVRADADWFLFSDDPDAQVLRGFWFRVAGWYTAPSRPELELMMARTLEHRHPKEAFCL